MDKCQADTLQHNARLAGEGMVAAGEALDAHVAGATFHARVAGAALRAQLAPVGLQVQAAMGNLASAFRPVAEALARAAVPLAEALRQAAEAGQVTTPSGEDADA